MVISIIVRVRMGARGRGEVWSAPITTALGDIGPCQVKARGDVI